MANSITNIITLITNNAEIGFTAIDDEIPFLSSEELKGNVSKGGEISQLKISRNGKYYFHYTDILYDKIHVIPAPIDFGVITNNVAIQVEVWNAFLEDKTLLTTDGDYDQGLFFEENLTNLVFTFNSSKILNLVADSEGVSAMDAILNLNFNGYTTSFNVTGNRDIGTWHYKPESGYVESFSYNTDIINSYDGDEQRISLLQDARFLTSYNYLLSNEEYAKSKSFLNKKLGSKFFSPQWSQASLLTQAISINDLTVYFDTSNKNIQADQTIMIKSKNDFENVQIATVYSDRVDIKFATTKSFEVGSTEVIPCYFSYIENISASVITDKDARMSVSFKYDVNELYNVLPASYSLPQYNGFNLLLTRPDKTAPLDIQFNRDALTLDSGYGVRVIQDINDQNFNTFNYNFFLDSYDKINEFKAFVNDIRGRAVPFYIPSFERDIYIKEDESVSTTENILVIKNVDYTKNYLLHFRDIIVQYKDGSYSIYNIKNSIVNEDSNFENLTLDRNFDKIFNGSEVERISFLYQARFLSDTTTINYVTDKVATVSKNIKILKFTKNNLIG
jgi:hypothetical protein